MTDTTIICEHTEFNQDCTPCKAKELMAESNCKDCTCVCCVWPLGNVVDTCQCAPCVKHLADTTEWQVANAEREERKQAEREAMDTWQAAQLNKIHRADQMDAGNKANRREVKRQENVNRERHNEQEQRRMDRVDARWAESQGDTVDGDTLTLADFTQEVSLLEEERIPPALTRSDGETLVYEGRFNTFTAETAQGKSWLGIMVALERLREGRNVLILDFEDRPTTLATRLQKIGGTPFIGAPELKWATGELTDHSLAVAEALAHLADGTGPGLVIIDSAGSGGCPSDGADVMPWLQKNVFPWIAAGHTVLLLDHVPKQRKDRPRGGIGSTAKLRELDGVNLYLEGKVWNATQDGFINLFNHKDRNGQVPGQLYECVATIFGKHDGPIIRYTIDPPSTKPQEEDLQIELLEAITLAGGVTGSIPMRRLLKGKRAKDVDSARDELLQQGLIERRKVGRAYAYFAVEN